jgi:ectoine hydroxylase-related dioxygenase (phytanoyl-CoA dioxygenase family)
MNLPAHLRLPEDANFHRYGYTIVRGDSGKLAEVKVALEGYLRGQLETFGVSTGEGFSLNKYHRHFEHEPALHYKFIKTISRHIPSTVFGVDHPMMTLVLDRARELFGRDLMIYNGTIEFRVVRPGHDDNNTLHRDHWFPYFIPLVNVYVPLSSSLFDSAMKVVPCSHFWSDDDVTPEFPYEGGKSVNSAGVFFSVPGIKVCKKTIVEHRPDILFGDFMLFSPFLIHGGGSNSSLGTRFSLEIRLGFVEPDL